MNTSQLSKVAYRFTPDLLVLDNEQRIVLLVRTKGNQEILGRNISEAIDWVKDANGAIQFTMFADLENIQIFKWDSPNLSEPVCTLNTADVLKPYGLDMNDSWIFSSYLGSRIEIWLRDLNHHWDLENPPAEKEITAIGLLPLLKDVIIQPSEVEIKIDPEVKYTVLRYYYPRVGWDD